MEKVVELWHRAFKSNALAENGGVLIPMRGYKRVEDFYLCVPVKGIHFRSANNARYGAYKCEVFIDGEFIGSCRQDKCDKLVKLYNAGAVNEARLYALGYMLWRETLLGGSRVNAAKERARLSHALCDLPGKQGHEFRQCLRYALKNNML